MIMMSSRLLLTASSLYDHARSVAVFPFPLAESSVLFRFKIHSWVAQVVFNKAYESKS